MKASEYVRSTKIFKRLVEGGFSENNRQLAALELLNAYIPQLLDGICSMKQLKKLNVLRCKLKLEQLLRVFRSCPKLTELNLTYSELWVSEMLKMDGHLIKELRRGFQRLQHCELDCRINGISWPVIQQMLT